MASDILVKIGADITDFSRKMAQSQQALQNFTKANQSTADAFKQVGGSLTKYVTAPAAAAVAALTGITLVKGFGRLVGIDTARAKLTALGHDAESVETIMDNALEAVKGTSYGMDEAATTAANAVAAGVPIGKELTDYLTLTGDAAAIAGTSMTEMGSIINKVTTAGKAYNGELQMLSDRGLPIYQWLADEAGTTADAIFDMASQGEVSTEMFLKAIENNIGGAAKVMGEESFAAALKNIGSDIARIGANFLDAGGEGEGFFSTLKPLLSDFRGYLETLEGKAADLGTKFGEAFTNMIETTRDLKARYDELSPAMQDFIKKTVGFGAVFLVALGPILKFIGFIPNIIAGFSAVWTVVKAVGSAIALIASPIGLVVTAVIGLAYLIYRYWDEIKAFTIEAWGAIAEFFVGLWQSIKDGVVTGWQAISEYFVELWESIKEVALTAWDGLVSGVMTLVQPFIDGIMNIFNNMKDGLETLWSGLADYFTGAWDLIKNIFLGAVLLILNLVTGNFEELSDNARAIWDNIKDALGQIWEGIKGIFSGALSAIWGFVTGAWQNIKTNTTSIFNTVKETITDIWNGIKTFFTTTLSDIWNTVKQKFTDVVNTVREKMDDVKQRIEDGWDKAKAFLEGIDLKQIGKDIIQGLINGIKDKVKAVGDAVKSVTDEITGKIKSILKISSPSRLLKQYGVWTGEGLADGITDSVRMVERASDKLSEAAMPSIDMSYATPNGLRTSLSSAVNGTVDVNSRDSALIHAIGSLERRLGDLEVVMDGERVGRIVTPHVSRQQASDVDEAKRLRGVRVQHG